MGQLVLAETIVRFESNLQFELVAPVQGDAVRIGSPNFESLPLSIVPASCWQSGAYFLISLNSRHEVQTVLEVPAIARDVGAVTEMLEPATEENDSLVLTLSPRPVLNGAQVPIDVAYAVLTDAILKHGWVSDSVYKLNDRTILTYVRL